MTSEQSQNGALARAHTFSGKLSKDRQVAAALGRNLILQGNGGRLGGLLGLSDFGTDHKPRSGDIVVGWGKKSNTRRGASFARKNDLPFYRLEDGFIGYLDHPGRDQRRLSVVCDSQGIYYDASAPSDLEDMLAQPDWMTPELETRARALRERICAIGASKYNHAGSRVPMSVSAPEGQKILVVDQTKGDLSIRLGGAGSAAFGKMLDMAVSNHPEATIFLKVHPDVLLGKKRGHFDLSDLPANVVPLAVDVGPHDLLAHMDAVYVVTSQYGFDALLAGVPVHVFGQPFYAGWGLTIDYMEAPKRRTGVLALETLIAAALVRYPIYIDPFTGKVSDIDSILDHVEALCLSRRLVGRRVFPLGFSLWKRGFLRAFCADAREYRPITKRALEVIEWSPGDVVLVWGRSQDHIAKSLEKDVEVWRIEDGFLRSAGLGSDLARPASLAFDGRGIYYDAQTESDLEHALATQSFSDRQLARGEALIQSICAFGITKYNVGRCETPDFRQKAGGRTVVLVPGQVESDASLAFGSPDIQKNEDLLRAVRRARPDAYIVYKPHPDVLARNRQSGRADTDGHALDYCDQVVMDVDIHTCFGSVDEVHVMTSLAGFEALIRGLHVVCY